MKNPKKNDDILKKHEVKNILIASNIYAEIEFEHAKEDVKRTDCSAVEIKKLTTDILETVSDKHDIDLMCHIAQKVENWHNDKTFAWKSSLAEYARTHIDIEEVYCGNGEKEHEFIIITNSNESDIILQHNEFCFELFDKYDDIIDFVVLRKEEFLGMRDYYNGFSKIY